MLLAEREDELSFSRRRGIRQPSHAGRLTTPAPPRPPPARLRSPMAARAKNNKGASHRNGR